jgi:branched-chain amino acid transport system substrate-binding protein
MKHFALTLFLAFGVSLAAASIARAEILVGVPAPYTGAMAWGAEETERGVEMAVAHLNAAGGVLGQRIRIIKADDFCDADQAVAAADKLVADRVDVVLGHQCSGAAIPASKVYAEAGILMMTEGATNPLLTEQGLSNVFRIVGRDDEQGPMVGNYLADHWGDSNIAILHDGEAYGRGLAQEIKETLNAHGISESMFQRIDPGLVDYFDVVEKTQANEIDVLYYAGYQREAALLVRQLRSRGSGLQFISGDGVTTEDYGLIAGDAADGTLFTAYSEAQDFPEAGSVVAAFRAENLEPRGTTLLAYAALQAWAQAVEQAGTLKIDRVTQVLRSEQFETVLGKISFDEKGDVGGYEPFAWYVWQDGNYAPVDPAEVTE